MNLGNLKGYSTGGSLHIITNNRIGFTTEPIDDVQQLFYRCGQRL